MKMAQKAITLDESNAAAYSTLGIILAVKRQYEEAIAASMDQWNVEIGNFIQQNSVKWQANKGLQLIGEQKWVALYMIVQNLIIIFCILPVHMVAMNKTET